MARQLQAGGWPSIVLTYAFGVLGSASLSKLIPLQQDYVERLGISPASFGLLLAGLTLPPALFAALGGSLSDRFGTRRALIASALLGALINALYLLAEALPAFFVLRVLEGFILVGAYSAAPALIMATTQGTRRGHAMAFWSTYTPVGVSVGLLLSGHFAGSDSWRGGYALHALLWLLLALAGLFLPRVTAAGGPRPASGITGLFDAWRQRGPLRIALCFGLVVVMGFGVSSVFPAWYAAQRNVSIAAASSLLATANLAMVAGSLLSGVLLGRGLAPRYWLVVLAVLGSSAATALFWPGSPAAVVAVALGLWLMSSGASMATLTSSLPRVLTDPTRGAAAAGLLSQWAALSTLFTPQLWLLFTPTNTWQGFIAIIVVCWVLTLWVFPLRAGR